MDEELEREVNASSSIQTQASEQAVDTADKRLANLPRYEDIRKSEREVSFETKISGVEEVESDILPESRTFAKKSDQKKVLAKKRLKIVTGVYVSIVALLLTFVGVNIFALTTMNGIVNANTTEIATMEGQLSRLEQAEIVSPEGIPFTITENPPRDYSDEDVELTFFDKISIVFRHLFG